MTDVADDRRWPSATLDRIARLRVVAAGLPGVHLHERELEAGFDDVWAFVSDLERTTPLFEPDVASLRILEQDGTRWRIQVRMPRWAAGMPLRLDVTMQDGWCWMITRPRLYAIGIAAEPTTTGTRVAHLEGLFLPVPAWVRPLTKPLLAVSRWRHRIHVPRDLARMAALLE